MSIPFNKATNNVSRGKIGQCLELFEIREDLKKVTKKIFIDGKKVLPDKWYMLKNNSIKMLNIKNEGITLDKTK